MESRFFDFLAFTAGEHGSDFHSSEASLPSGTPAAAHSRNARKSFAHALHLLLVGFAVAAAACRGFAVGSPTFIATAAGVGRGVAVAAGASVAVGESARDAVAVVIMVGLRPIRKETGPKGCAPVGVSGTSVLAGAVWATGAVPGIQAASARKTRIRIEVSGLRIMVVCLLACVVCRR